VTAGRRGARVAGLVAASALVTAIAAIGVTAARQSTALVVVTDRGAVRGTARAGMRRFLGIPYAAAPVGGLRWRPPRRHPAWTGVRGAKAFHSSCPQVPSLLWQPSTDEDCLFLNVFTPLAANAGSGYPVMVWIHGGGLVSGESSDYLPAGLVARGVVVVTLNYRLGVLGFLAHPSLTAESLDHASGNYGLLDQQFALRWVQQNIGRFGGDPRNVTIFGESAGGLSVHAQLASPRAHGLFQRAIVQSGGYAGNQPSLTTAEAAGKAFAARIGCRTATCLRRIPVSTLLASQPSLDVTPVIDGHVLTRSITGAFASGRFNRVPVIEGSNHDELRFFLATNDPAGSAPLTASGYRPAIAATLGVRPAVAATIAAYYPLSRYPSPSLALGAVGTDALFACRARAASRALSRYVPTYEYEFNDENAPSFSPAPNPGFPLGAFHTAELQYLFVVPAFPSRLAGDHDKLAQAMRDLWTTFAKTGDPGSGWPRYSAATDETESLAPPQPATESDFAAVHECVFWSHTPVATS
jgi:para-nitrobenzyl esterase